MDPADIDRPLDSSSSFDRLSAFSSAFSAGVDHSLELHVDWPDVHERRHVRIVEGYVQKYGHPHDGDNDHGEQTALVRGVHRAVHGVRGHVRGPRPPVVDDPLQPEHVGQRISRNDHLCGKAGGGKTNERRTRRLFYNITCV